MKLTRFKTDWRLWLRLSLALFLVSWFLPIVGIGQSNDPSGPCILVLVWWVGGLFKPDVSSEFVLFGACLLGIFSCVSAILSCAAAWFLHCAIVFFRTKRQRNQ